MARARDLIDNLNPNQLLGMEVCIPHPGPPYTSGGRYADLSIQEIVNGVPVFVKHIECKYWANIAEVSDKARKLAVQIHKDLLSVRNLILNNVDPAVAFSKFNFEFKASIGINSVTELRTQLKALFNNPAYNTQEITSINKTIVELRNDLNTIPQIFGPNALYDDLDEFIDSATLGANNASSIKLIN